MPKLGEEDRQRRLWAGLPFALIAGDASGFTTVFRPAAGSFYALAFVTLCGYNLGEIHGTCWKVLSNATSNVGGLLLFIIGGKVIWAMGFVMLVGQF